MLKDIGFWNEQGEYIPDIQEVSEVEMSNENEIIIDGELSCNNCLEKTRCKEQQEAKEQRIDAILSYIANEDNEKYIAELKNEIPAITRCDVVLEKQLKRLEQNLIKCDDNIIIDCKYKENDLCSFLHRNKEVIRGLEQENADLKKYIERMDKPVVEVVDADIALENAELKAENERLKEIETSIENYKRFYSETHAKLDELDCVRGYYNYKQTLQEIKAIAEEGLQSICYKANCATCRCYSKKILNDTLENIINNYFDEDGDFTDTEGDFFEVLQAFIDRERVACNKAQPISEKILDCITKAEEE